MGYTTEYASAGLDMKSLLFRYHLSVSSFRYHFSVSLFFALDRIESDRRAARDGCADIIRDRYGIFLSGVENCELWCDVLVIVRLDA
jgi:hypothetical protein